MNGESISSASGARSTWVRNTLLWLAHFFGSLLIVYMFMVVLMSAVAQQSVVDQLADGDVSGGYSSAYAKFLEIKERRLEVPAQRNRIRQLQNELPELDSRRNQLRAQFDASWPAFLPLARRSAATCGIELPADLNPTEVRLALWHEVRQCAFDRQLSLSLRSAIARMDESDSGLGRVAMQLSQAEAAFQDKVGRIQFAQRRMDASLTLAGDEAKIFDSFGEMDALLDSWVFLTGYLVTLPPSIVLLFLAAASGAFGALLLTLILIVYPANALSMFTASNSATRLLLGALSAVVVYILMLGGTSVLGTTASGDGSEANYMAFCAVGVLAGMFSDRVAALLSRQATIFFPPQQNQGQENQPDTSRSGQATEGVVTGHT